MILRAEPRQIMRFVEDNFEILQDLYQVQLKQHLIPAETFQEITRHKGDIVTRRLSAYKIMREVGDDYRMADQVGNYLGFLTQEFKPMLPEQLRRYHGSIRDLFSLLNLSRDMDDDTRALRLERLYDEIQSFLDNVTNNTYTLLKRTQRLKANRRQLTYAERLREANQLIVRYIDPLTQIVNLHDEKSIASLLQKIGRDINLDRLGTHAPTVTDRYEQLDSLLRQVNGHLLREADVIRRELMPLIDRIQRESEVLAGFLAFLEKPFLIPTPDMSRRHNIQVFGDQTQADLRMYVEQFVKARKRPRITVGKGLAIPKTPVFQRAAYRERLQAALPVPDFFAWCEELMVPVAGEVRERYLLSLISLLFSDDRYALTFFAEYRLFPVDGFDYRLPRISVAARSSSAAQKPLKK